VATLKVGATLKRGVRRRRVGRAGRERVDPVLLVVCLAVAATQMAWAVVVPVLPAYAEDFGAGATELGLIVAMFGIGRLVVNVPAGLLSQRVDPRKLLVAAVVGVVALQVATGFAPNITVLLGCRFVLGLAGGTAITCGMILVSELTTTENRGRAMSMLQGIQLIGGSFGPALGGVAATFWGNRAPFLVCGLMALLVVVFGSRTLLRAPLPRPEVPTRRSRRAAAEPSPVRKLLRDRSFLAVCVVAFSVFLHRFGGMQSLIPIIAYSVVGLSVAQFGVLLGAVTLSNLLTVSLAGSLSDRFGRKRVIVPGLLVIGAALPMYAVTSDPIWFVAVTVVTGLASGISGPAPAAYVADVSPEGGRGPAVGIYRTAGDLAAVVGPVALGWLVDLGDHRLAVFALAAVVLFAGALFGFAARETWRGTARQGTA
jgi:DHA1 family multidrug resistance protein-like MFS transporter